MKTILICILGISILNVYSQNYLKLKTFNLDNKLALSGYDPVSYFKNSKPSKGNKTISASIEGVVYLFVNEANKQEFQKSPSKYDPQYGGWCAYAMGSTGEKVEVDPETYKIINGKLYLFYNQYFNNTLKDWNKNETSLKIMADNNWGKIFNQQ